MLTAGEHRAMDMNKLRVEALVRVMGGLSNTEFADRYDLNASYLSQILNGHRPLGERAAANMEKKIGLPDGTLSRPQVTTTAQGQSVAPAYLSDEKYQQATPEHRQAVDELADKLLGLSPEQALKVKQAMELLMPSDDTRKD